MPDGYSGFAPLGREGRRKPERPLQPELDACNAGRYRDAEAAASKIVKSAAGSSDPAARKQAVQAHEVLAFSAARRDDMELARDWFEVLRREAAKLPDKGKRDARRPE